MEGADPIVTPAQVPEWYRAGVRIVGTSWGQTRYAGGTRAPGGLTPDGRELLPEMEHAGLILDTSHMAEQSFFEALEIYHGAVIASHSNCRAFVNTDRQLSDGMIRSLVERDGVIGSVIYNRFVKADWDTSALKDAVSLTDVMEHMLHICDIAGDANHIGIGTDFDGGFGRESSPREIDTIADLQKLGDVLAARFSDEEITGILGGNWIRILRRALPR
jgi:membrane dipeptidase